LLGERLGGHIEAFKNVPYLFVIPSASLGQRNGTGVAVEQRLANDLLQPANLTRDRRHCAMEMVCGGGEAAGGSDALEDD
jgi:hypothetical protein